MDNIFDVDGFQSDLNFPLMRADSFAILQYIEGVNRKMKLIPLGDKVVVRPMEAEETTAGGIVLPDAAQEKPRQGRILSVGDGGLNKDGTRSEHEVTEGDRVLYSQYSGTEVAVDGEALLILSESDILAIVA